MQHLCVVLLRDGGAQLWGWQQLAYLISYPDTWEQPRQFLRESYFPSKPGFFYLLLVSAKPKPLSLLKCLPFIIKLVFIVERKRGKNRKRQREIAKRNLEKHNHNKEEKYPSTANLLLLTFWIYESLPVVIYPQLWPIMRLSS